ncbi:DUF1592 domain-containing protein [Pirellulaceae bacterium SH449]
MSLASRNVTRGVALTMVLYASLSFSSADLQARNIPDGEFLTKLNRFFKDYCFECHNQEHAEGEFRIEEELLRDFQSTQARSKWREIINVLNSHEMPPADAKQPRASDVAAVVDWATNQIVQQERELRENAVVMRRLNRIEYQNTIRELTGIDYDISHFPLDPSASGFDNVGSALSLSPMQIEMYLEAAETVLDEALDLSEQPEPIRWRFEIDSGDSDANRVRIGGNNAIVNGGNNPVINGFKMIHHDSWDKKLNVRDFVVKDPGYYIIRFRAASRIPDREEVVRSATTILDDRRQKQDRENPKGKRWHDEQFEKDLEHFQNDRMYDYGPSRAKVVLDLGGQPRTVGELDIPTDLSNPELYEVRVRLTTDRIGITIENAYSVPSVLENFWMQRNEHFARPELYVDWIELEGPVYDEWPPASRALLLPTPITESNEQDVALRLLSTFASRAFRRPVDRGEIEPHLTIYQRVRSQGSSPLAAYKTALSSILISPNFLFLVEADPTDKLSAHELAVRLSYFLWAAPPDQALRSLADNGKLLSAETLSSEVDRMLEQRARSEALVENFADQWLGLREIGSNPPAIDLYPHYDRHLEISMREESRGFFRTVLFENRNVLDFVDSDYVFINERLARFYGIDGVRGDWHRVVSVKPQHHRGGVMTQASMLTITSNGTRTSPVKRGTWVLKNILGADPGLPVANAGDIAPSVPGIDKATVRTRLEIHRELPQCARCHNKIDPLGLALENYNASGEFRIREGFGYKGRVGDNDPVIDASVVLPDGTQVLGPDSLRRFLREQEDDFLRCLSDKLLVYALGREITLADQSAIGTIVDHTKSHGYKLREMIRAIVLSEPFQAY